MKYELGHTYYIQSRAQSDGNYSVFLWILPVSLSIPEIKTTETKSLKAVAFISGQQNGSGGNPKKYVQ